MKLQNKTALITGGTSGIGLATAQDFIREGAKVIITGRDEITLHEVVQQLGENASGIVCDAGNIHDILALPVKLTSIDILFCNAGYGKFAPIEAVTVEQFDELFDILVKGVFFTTQAVLPLMKEGGSIIFNTSVVTLYGSPYASVYSAAKSAVASFIKTFAAECTAKGIRVNGVSPGYTESKGFEKTGMSAEQIEGVKQSVIPTLPFKRFGKAMEIAKAVSFLASDDASYLHATELIVDGGYSTIK
ncbi:SDR family oxidoreductase [Chitinophaga niabensis]|uniref:SDR family oxidoreductase n=1 Tax=Chitinophaga niabensis TaxID=536979 RepID=UPI0031BBA884